MKKILRVFSLIFALIVLSPISCSPNGSAIDFYAFNTAIHVETHDKKLSEDTITKLNNEIKRLDAELNAHDQNSYVYKINSSKAQTPIIVSNDVINLLSLSNLYHEFSNGKFNHTLYPVIEAWQFYDYPKLNFTPPTNAQLNEIKDSGVLFPRSLNINTTDNSIIKTNVNTKIDFGGIAKGYVVDLIKDILIKDGHESGYVNAGGSSLYLLDVDSLTIKHPRATEKKPTVIEIFGQNVKNSAVSTSGDYQRYYQHNGQIYSHIIDGETCFPSSTNVISATIIGDSATFGDAMTTVLCCYDYYPNNHENSPLITFAKKIINQNNNCVMFLIYNDNTNKIILTNAKDNTYSLLDNEYVTKNI